MMKLYGGITMGKFDERLKRLDHHLQEAWLIAYELEKEAKEMGNHAIENDMYDVNTKVNSAERTLIKLKEEINNEK